jgi:hypothetical protein
MSAPERIPVLRKSLDSGYYPCLLSLGKLVKEGLCGEIPTDAHPVILNDFSRRSKNGTDTVAVELSNCT